jgi:hypothetical protein
VINIGDMFKNVESGEIFTVKSVTPNTILLTTKDGYHSMFVNPKEIDSAFLPFVEEEAKKKP